MPDNLNRRRPEDPRKINVSQPWEIQYWSDVLGCTPDKLRRAVNAVGPMVSDVERWLKQH